MLYEKNCNKIKNTQTTHLKKDSQKMYQTIETLQQCFKTNEIKYNNK